jgi:hypothetical protein
MSPGVISLNLLNAQCTPYPCECPSKPLLDRAAAHDAADHRSHGSCIEQKEKRSPKSGASNPSHHVPRLRPIISQIMTASPQ